MEIVRLVKETGHTYKSSLLQHSYVKMEEKGHILHEYISDILNSKEVTAHKNEDNFRNKALNREWQNIIFQGL